MDNKYIYIACMRVVVCVLVVRTSIIERERYKIYILRKSFTNVTDQRKFYIDSILNRGGRYCSEQIDMKLIYHLCVITNYNQHKKYLLGSK